MRKIIIISTVLMILGSVSNSFAQQNHKNLATTTEIKGINFYSGTWNEVLSLAKKENKIIFVDLSASWCVHCRKMKAKVFTDNEVAKYFNANFINISFDVDKGEGTIMKKKFEVKRYPTLLFIKPDGTIIKRVTGFQNPEKFLEIGKSVL